MFNQSKWLTTRAALLFIFVFCLFFLMHKIRFVTVSYHHVEDVRLIRQKNYQLGKQMQLISECGCFRKFFWPVMSGAVLQNSTCSDEATFYTTKQNVVSFSLFLPADENELAKQFLEGIELNLQKMRMYYPGYAMRIYTDITLTTSINNSYCNLVCNNSDLLWCDIRKTPSLGNQSPMFFMSWRFLPLGDPTVDIFLSRDLDSVISRREVAAVKDWLEMEPPKERKAFHTMRDKEAHNAVIMGGMWGARNSLLENSVAVRLQKRIVNMSKTEYHFSLLQKGWDQHVLEVVLFDPMKGSFVAHDSYNCLTFGGESLVRPFPVERKLNADGSVSDFVGNPGLGRAKYKDFTTCPELCRPSYGKNWKFC